MDEIVSRIKIFWHEDGHLNENQRDFLIEYLLKNKPKNCIETGFASGRSAATVLCSAEPRKLVSVDINLDYMTGARKHAETMEREFKNFKILEGSSANVLNNSFFESEFKEGIDFAFIDGDHTYSGALSDIKNIYNYMNTGSTMIVDDYYSCAPDGCEIIDVNKAVDNFCKENSINVERWHNNGKGFAIIKK